MPGPLHAWYGLQDLEGLCDREAALRGDVRLAELTRLSPLLHAQSDGCVAASLCCSRSVDGRGVLRLDFRADVELVCQRCLEPMPYSIDETVEWVLADDGLSGDAAGQGLEVLELGGERLRPLDLLEDEMIVSLPLVPRHASIDACGALAQNLRRVLTSRTDELVGRALDVKLGE
jgi:uncharacterized protein